MTMMKKTGSFYLSLMFSCILILLLYFDGVELQKIRDESFAKKWSKRVNSEYQVFLSDALGAAWDFSVNMTGYNSKKKREKSKMKSKYYSNMKEVAFSFDSSNFTDPLLKRWFTSFGSPSNVNKTLKDTMSRLKSEMFSTFNKAKVTLNGKQVKLDPDLTNFMKSNETYDSLLRVWKDWRDVTGRKTRNSYIKYIQIKNQYAREKGYNNYGDIITQPYDSKDFKQNMLKELEKLRPFYRLLHSYVLKRLKGQYGEDPFRSGHIPAHILGNMWAQTWINTDVNRILPYPGEPILDVSESMKKQNYTGRKIYKLANNFFISLGLKGVSESFFQDSLFEKPDDRDVVCQPSALDFRNGKDFRIKHCTESSMYHLTAAHHEMGHIQYFMQYKDLPAKFQRSPNPGFHEAIGDAIGLSVTTGEYLKAVNLSDNFVQNKKVDLNFLMQMALEKIVFLPYGFLLDNYRWKLYEKENFGELNKIYWDMRCRYQGIYPPVYRSEKDFDAAAKFHISADVPYIRYFFSYIFQFQLYKKMCVAANNTKPLNQCNFYKSKEAGKVLSRGMKLGNSKDWTEVMEVMIGESNLNVKPLLEYFEPLQEYLKKEVGEEVKDDWFPACPEKSFYSSGGFVNGPMIKLIYLGLIGSYLLTTFTIY